MCDNVLTFLDKKEQWCENNSNIYYKPSRIMPKRVICFIGNSTRPYLPLVLKEKFHLLPSKLAKSKLSIHQKYWLVIKSQQTQYCKIITLTESSPYSLVKCHLFKYYPPTLERKNNIYNHKWLYTYL